jgi:integrase
MCSVSRSRTYRAGQLRLNAIFETPSPARVRASGSPARLRRPSGSTVSAGWRREDTERREQGLVFPFEVGTPLSAGNLNRAFKATLQRAGLPERTRFHDLRHTRRYALAEAGRQPQVYV